MNGRWFSISGAVLLSVGVLLLLQPAAMADTMQLTSPPSDPSWIWNGRVYISPYQAKIDGAAPVNVICDDFFDDTWLGESWTATTRESWGGSRFRGLTV